MIVRAATLDEQNFVRSNWLRSYASSDVALLMTPRDPEHTVECECCSGSRLRVSRTTAGMTKYHSGQEYWSSQRQLINSLLLRSNVTVAEADDGLLDGFVVRDRTRPILHYVYVRQSARGQGIARALVADLAAMPTRYTHRSRGLDAQRVPYLWRWDLYALAEVA